MEAITFSAWHPKLHIHTSDIYRDLTGHDVHIGLNIFRLLVAISLAYSCACRDTQIISMVLMGSCGILIFPFIHDGFYYMIRNKIDGSYTEEGFFSKSKDTTAKFSIGAVGRTIMFVTSLILAILFDFVI